MRADGNLERRGNPGGGAKPISPRDDDRFRQATRCHQNGDFRQAETLYREVLADAPNHVGALNLLGVVMLQTGRLAQGIEWIDKALALRPDDADAHNNRGNALRELRRHEEALASFDRALSIRPNFPEALSNRGNVLLALEQYEQALASYTKALAIKPNYVEALSNRGAALWKLARLEEALVSVDEALAILPGHAGALRNRGGALHDLGRLDEALASYDQALAAWPGRAAELGNEGAPPVDSPDLADLLCDRALVQLSRGDLTAGWSGYESRWRRKKAPPRKLEACYPVWRGENLSGRRIIVHEEQGIGDIIQFSRYLPRLSRAGAEVTLLLRPNLHRLIASVDETLVLRETPPVGDIFDYQCALMSLPLACATTLETIPAEIPYLRAPAERVSAWKARLGEGGFKIGVAWQGSKSGPDIGRSFRLAELFGVSRIPNARLVSLQKHDGAEQLGELPEGMRVETLGDDFDAGEHAFLDAAAVMETLDLIISADTSIAHLAGALGRSVWVALKYVPDWRWLMHRSDTPWYPTMRLFRQRQRGQWTSVFAEIEAELASLRRLRETRDCLTDQ